MIQGDILTIGSRLREFRLRTNIKMPAVAAATGIAKETLYKWEKGTRPSNLQEYFKLKSYIDKTENKLEIERLDLEDKKHATLGLPLNGGKPAIPQMDGKVAAGTIIITDNEPQLIVDRITAPFLGAAEGVVEVVGQSMEPTFVNGCRIVISRLKDYRMLHWGLYYYIIDTNWHGIVRRVYQADGQNSLSLGTDNPDQLKYPPIEISLDQIESIFKVSAAIIKY
ncbi:LexA family transcriptional regulator [Longitalea luteola]|uniref:LexA family transcriptional regulator n=1 Tax=Longitalea luteola TaxID=2812563 RepID=UPI001A9780EF|nr:LexA family transcriptional regulator [Longitalea luteola]